ncbi:MAG: segregation/condensation protein A [Acidobacteriia bacterium]|nr:segregation/condensation protein A [Terriglobia bacterium]
MGEARDGAPGARDVSSSDDSVRVKVGGFEGPLDLLLHLVRINEVDIADIPIVEITAQYNAYLDLLRELNLEVAGEYVVMAATLMHIKSRMLLPADPMAEGEEREDPRAELTQQLIDYRRFKQAAENLQAIDSIRSLIWTREGSVPPQFAGEELVVADLYDLISAFRKLLGRLDDEARLRLARDDVSVADKIGWLADLLEGAGSVNLMTLFEEIPDRIHRIATFLAVLEMVRLQMIVAFQRRLLDEIWIASREPGFLGEGGEASRRG